MHPERFARVTCEVFSEISDKVEAALSDMGVCGYYLRQGRSVMLRENRFPLLRGPLSVMGEMSDVFEFCVPPGDETGAMDRIVEAGALYHEGRGSVYSERVEVIGKDRAPGTGRADAEPAAGRHAAAKGLVGIVCVVHRGQGDVMARHALEMGLCVPRVTFGIGAGLRDRLGLIRITIPAEKEIVHLVAPHHDEPGVLAGLIEAGRLDQPGRGFIYSYPIERAVLNTRLYVMRRAPMAGMGRIVAAIDDLKGGTEWRQKFTSAADRARIRKMRCFENMTIVTFFCSEGKALGLAKAAMDAGAGGATLGRLRRGGSAAAGRCSLSPAGERCVIVVRTDAVPGILKVLDEAGIFSDDGGEIHLSQCRKAYTYAGRHFFSDQS